MYFTGLHPRSPQPAVKHPLQLRGWLLDRLNQLLGITLYAKTLRDPLTFGVQIDPVLVATVDDDQEPLPINFAFQGQRSSLLVTLGGKYRDRRFFEG